MRGLLFIFFCGFALFCFGSGFAGALGVGMTFIGGETDTRAFVLLLLSAFGAAAWIYACGQIE